GFGRIKSCNQKENQDQDQKRGGPMRAIGIRRFGGREVLEELDLPIPKIEPHELLVRIKAAGLNPVDWKIREGLLQQRMPHHFPTVLGWERGGIMEGGGRRVTGWEKGESVFGYPRGEVIQEGCYAEYVRGEPRHIARKPENLSFEEAA